MPEYCKLCEKELSSAYSLKRHMENIHDITEENEDSDEDDDSEMD